MTKNSVSILPQDCKSQDELSEDILATGIRAFLQSLMEVEVEQLTGAASMKRVPTVGTIVMVIVKESG